MFIHTTYILFSETLQQFYIGCTSASPDERLYKHLCKHKGFTSKASDWKIVYTESFDSLEEARKRDMQLKKWKSHQRIKELIERKNKN